MNKSNARARFRVDLLIITGMVTCLAPKLGEITSMKVLVGPKGSSGLP